MQIMAVSVQGYWTCVLPLELHGSATAATIFEAMNGALESREILWDNCMGLSVDNTSVYMGNHNSIQARAVQKNPGVYMIGCPCHILHNTAQKASLAFRDIRSLAPVRIYYLVYAMVFLTVHICVRCLSLQAAVDRALSQYPAFSSPKVWCLLEIHTA